MRQKPLLMIGLVLAALGLVSVLLWMALGRGGDEFAQCRQGGAAGLAALGGDFELTDENGERVTSAEVFDRPTLLYFGYTFCPDVCPLDNARNAEAVDLVQQQREDDGQGLRMVFVTVDPQRDTPEMLRDFTDVMHPTMYGLTGTEEEIAAVNKLWRNFYQKNDEDDSEYYLVDHMTNTYLVLPEAGTVNRYLRDETPAAMAESIGCFLDKRRAN